MEVRPSQHRWLMEQVRAGRCSMVIDAREISRRLMGVPFPKLAQIVGRAGRVLYREVTSIILVEGAVLLAASIALGYWLGWWAILAVPAFFAAHCVLLKRCDPAAFRMGWMVVILALSGALAAYFSELGHAFQTFVLSAASLHVLSRVRQCFQYHLIYTLLENNHEFFMKFFTGIGEEDATLRLYPPKNAPAWVSDLVAHEDDEEWDEEDEDEDEDYDDDEYEDDELPEEDADLEGWLDSREQTMFFMADAIAADEALHHVRGELNCVASRPREFSKDDFDNLLHRVSSTESRLEELDRALSRRDGSESPATQGLLDALKEHAAAAREVCALLKTRLAEACDHDGPLTRKEIRVLNEISPLLERRRRNAFSKLRQSATRLMNEPPEAGKQDARPSDSARRGG